jgi:hypothetical protein
VSRTTGRPRADDDLVPFYNGPWDGVVLYVRLPTPATIVVRTVAPPKFGPNGRAWRLPELLDVADGGRHVYRRRWNGPSSVQYHYVGPC